METVWSHALSVGPLTSATTERVPSRAGGQASHSRSHDAVRYVPVDLGRPTATPDQ